MTSLPVVDRYQYKALFAAQVYVESILALQKKACEDRGKPVELELVIMTSDDTHSRTKDLLDNHGHFGIQQHQLHLLKQEKVTVLVQKASFALGIYVCDDWVYTYLCCLSNAQCACEQKRAC